MTRQACTHGSVSRLSLHLHWCRSCNEWRWYRFRGFYGPGQRRGAIARWSADELDGMGSFSLDEVEPDELLNFTRGLLLRIQVLEAEARDAARTGGVVELQSRLRRRMADPS